MIAKIVIIAFILLEASNVLALYFAPGSKRANAVGVFSAWEKSKQYPEIHDFVKYLVYWVAGAKLIFLFLLGGIALLGDLNLRHRRDLLKEVLEGAVPGTEQDVVVFFVTASGWRDGRLTT